MSEPAVPLEHESTPTPAPTSSPEMSMSERLIFESRWLLYPVNIALLVALVVYILNLLWGDVTYTWELLHGHYSESISEDLMVFLLGLVDAAMVANLIIMIVLGSHQVFISKYNLVNRDAPQFLDHMDTGIMKVKVALSISGITLIQVLKDFVHIESVHWETVVHRSILHGMTLLSAIVMAVIWRLMHPSTRH